MVDMPADREMVGDAGLPVARSSQRHRSRLYSSALRAMDSDERQRVAVACGAPMRVPYPRTLGRPARARRKPSLVAHDRGHRPVPPLGDTVTRCPRWGQASPPACNRHDDFAAAQQSSEDATQRTAIPPAGMRSRLVARLHQASAALGGVGVDRLIRCASRRPTKAEMGRTRSIATS